MKSNKAVKNTAAKSTMVICGLLVSTMLMVNCQKTPNRKGVKANTKVTQENTGGPISERIASDLKACSADMVSNHIEMKKLYSAIMSEVTNNLETEQKTSVKASRIKFLELCDLSKKVFSRNDVQSCQAEAGTISYSAQEKACGQIGADLQAEDKVDNVWAQSAKVIAAADEKAAAQERGWDRFMKMDLLLSNDAKSMTRSTGINWQVYIVDGQVQTATQADAAVIATEDEKQVCSFTGEITANFGKSYPVILNILAKEAATKADLPDGFSGKAMSLNVTIKSQAGGSEMESEEETDLSVLRLTCLNLDAEKSTVADLQKALGDKISAQIVVEETAAAGVTSSDVTSGDKTTAGTTGPI